MTSDEIRERYLSYFAERGHHRLPSAPLVPRNDPSTLLISAGMHPLKPYFLGLDKPPAQRLTTAQKCFRTVDIDNIGKTYRHLTFFEMMGNFSIGDYFKQGAVEYAWDFSLNGFGFAPERIWVTIFEGDDALGLGPDEEAIDAWLSVGVPRERIVPLSRKDNFWQAGPTGPCGPCSELYLDRGPEFGSDDELPGSDGERFLEYWNLVFMQYDQNPEGVLTPLPAKNIDTGLGLNRLAAIMQGTTSVFETDQIRPLVTLGEELSGKRYGEDEDADRAMRILADHTRGMSFLVADGVVPSNEDRGYVLRRLMRRAVVQGRRIGIESGFLPRFAGVVRELMGSAYPELHEQRETIEMWLRTEEEAFNRTLEQGMRLLDDVIVRARDAGEEGIGADQAFLLHDTYGFPFDLTLELAAEQGLGVDEQGFEELMSEQRARARSAGRGSQDSERERIRAFAESAGAPTTFTGYDRIEQATAVGAVARENGRMLLKLVESPFYATGGGQVADAGVVECEDGDCRARVVDVVRVGDDQALVLEPEEGELHEGERVVARVDPAHRRPTACNHTATHLLHAALRAQLGSHVRQAGSYVGPDKLRFDFTHGQPVSADDLRDIEDQVNAWVLANHPVRALTTTLDEAKSLGAMALFGEKYGDVVRMVEVGDGSWSRELCGGTHVRSTAEIGVFKVTTETSSAANVRRIEAVTGPVAVQLLRHHDAVLSEAAAVLRTSPENVAAAAADREAKRRDLEKAAKSGGGAAAVSVSADGAEDVAGARVLVAQADFPDAKAMPDAADKLRGQLGDPSVVVLGSAAGGRVSLLVAASPGAVERGVKAGAIVKAAAAVVGGGGGGRDSLAQAGGRDAAKLPEALEVAKAEIAAALGA
jgi:alanyl-tRNA synthetase